MRAHARPDVKATDLTVAFQAKRSVWLTALVLLCLMMATTTSGRAMASDLVTWDSLVPAATPYDDPFVDMSADHKSDLRAVLLHQKTVGNGTEDAFVRSAADAARLRLDAAGLDADQLLRQRLIVMQRREEDATGVASTLLDRPVLIDGYVLPLARSGERVIEFLLVPWIGACIHTPPPPPNQIIHVKYPKGLLIERRFDAVRLSGVLRHVPASHDLFLIDGTRRISVSYGLASADIAGAADEVVAASAASHTLSPFNRAQLWISGLFTSAMSDLGREGSGRAIFMALLIAFGYGALHTLGPGHGKAVVISYFVGTGGSVRRGVRMGVQIAAFHVISAVVVVLMLDFAVRHATGSAPSDYRLIRLFSYAAIALIGAIMLWQAVTAWISQSRSVHSDQCHGHTPHDGPRHSCAACATADTPGPSGAWIAAAVGVVPCTGALIVMLFGLANDLVWPAVLMVAAISLGMAMAMSVIGVAAVWGRNLAEAGRASPARRARFQRNAGLAGAACVFAIGCILFMITLLHPGTGPALQTDMPGSVSASVDENSPV